MAKSSGFCFGVKRAIDIAIKSSSGNKNICMLGDIVHNEFVVNKIKESGIKKICSLKSGKGKSLLIRAHGIPRSLFEKALKAGYRIIDATCPMVKEIHKIAKKMEKSGYRIIVIGDKNHDEVRGIVGQLKKRAIVIDNINKVPLKKIKKACIVVQSTQNLEYVTKIIEKIKPHIQELKFFNTICKPTTIRQEETKKLPLENDVMVIIGSKGSANTKRLYEISKSLNPRSYWVESKNDIKKAWLRNAKSVGVSSGASTPDEITQGVIKFLR